MDRHLKKCHTYILKDSDFLKNSMRVVFQNGVLPSRISMYP